MLALLASGLLQSHTLQGLNNAVVSHNTSASELGLGFTPQMGTTIQANS